MDSEAIRRKRLEDIESKRKRLEEMRKSRTTPSNNTNTMVDNEKNDLIGTKIDTDTLVSSLLASNPVTDNANKDFEDNENNDINIPSLVSIQDVRIEKLKSLSTVKCGSVLSILPTSQIMYDKSIQTDEEQDQLCVTYNNVHTNQSSTINELLSSAATGQEQAGGSIVGLGLDTSQYTSSDLNNMEQQLHVKKKINEVECTKIMANSDFISFLHTASLYAERALTISEQHMDILKDFSTDNSNKSNDYIAGDSPIQVTNTKYQEESILGRPIMHMQWSPLVPDMFLAAYGSKTTANNTTIPAAMYNNNNNSSNTSDEDILPGLVSVWSKDFHTRAEFKFVAPSPVLTAIFHSHEPHLILGGCYSGQILLWDMRTQTGKPKRVRGLPVQRSSTTGKGHKHPVYAMTMVSNNTISSATGGLMVLISVSNDGLLCQWDITRLMEPLTVIQLQSFGNISLLNISAMAVLSNNNSSSGNSGEAPTDIIFGSSSGIIIHSTLPFKEGNPDTIKLDCHCGLITSIHPHPSRNNKYKHLLLTSSLDWTVKLWDLKNFNKPLIEFPSSHYDYVCDVQWSPINPAVFITITSGGKITLWNLSKSIVEPVDSIIINTKDATTTAATNNNSTTNTLTSSNSTSSNTGASNDVMLPNPSSSSSSKVALNRTLWARDGQSFLIGDSYGTLYLIKLLSSMSSASQLSSSDETRFELAMLNRNDYTDNLESESKYENNTNDDTNSSSIAGGILDDESASSLKDDFDAISITNA